MGLFKQLWIDATPADLRDKEQAERESAPQFVSLDDPCPHVTRLDVIRAKLGGGDGLHAVLEHLADCAQART